MPSAQPSDESVTRVMRNHTARRAQCRGTAGFCPAGPLVGVRGGRSGGGHFTRAQSKDHRPPGQRWHGRGQQQIACPITHAQLGGPQISCALAQAMKYGTWSAPRALGHGTDHSEVSKSRPPPRLEQAPANTLRPIAGSTTTTPTTYRYSAGRS